MSNKPQLPPISELNSDSLSQEDFIKVTNVLFESAPPLASSLFRARPFKSYQQLIEAAEAIVTGLSFDEKLQVINAHPRIGERKPVSAFSYKEQGCDKDAALASKQEKEKLNQTLATLDSLNKRYEEKFGFKFVVFVNGRSKEELVPVLLERLEHKNASEELMLGLKEMMAIAKDRLSKLN